MESNQALKPIIVDSADKNRKPKKRAVVHFASEIVDNDFKRRTDPRTKRKKSAVADESKRGEVPSPINVVQQTPAFDPTILIEKVHEARRRQAALRISTPQGPKIQAAQVVHVPPYAPDPPARQSPPPTPRIARLPTPDIPDVYDERRTFWQCHDPQSEHRGVQRRVEAAIEDMIPPPPYSKMNDQYQAAVAHMGGRIPMARQQRDPNDPDFAFLMQDSLEVRRLMALGYPRGVAIATLKARGNDAEKAAQFLNRNYFRRY